MHGASGIACVPDLTASSFPDRAPAWPSGAIGAWECRFPGDLLTWTDGVYDIFGLRRGDRIHRADTLDHYEERSRLDMTRLRTEAIATGRAFSLDCRIRGADGKRRWMRLVVGVEHRQGRTARIFGSKQDITAEKGLWAELAQGAQFKAVTPAALLREFEDAWRAFAARADGLGCALVIYGIDEYVHWLEREGPAAAAGLHQQARQRVGRLFPDALAHGSINEDSFAVLLPVAQQSGRLVSTLEGARSLLQRPIAAGETLVGFRLSAGAAVCVPNGAPEGFQRLMAGAEAALRAARLKGGDQLRLFDGPLSGRVCPAPTMTANRRGAVSLSPSRP